jgi:hypothetical protein
MTFKYELDVPEKHDLQVSFNAPVILSIHSQTPLKSNTTSAASQWLDDRDCQTITNFPARIEVPYAGIWLIRWHNPTNNGSLPTVQLIPKI